jgi:putative N6-adenine-specific DNA methylase
VWQWHFLIEAAQIALGVAAGARRDFAFQKLRNFDSAAWKTLYDAARAGEKPLANAGIFGSDISPVAVRAALANLDRAGLLPAVSLRSGDLLDIEAPAGSGIMVSNPPYGERVSSDDELAAFYPLLGQALKQGFAGWTCYLISADTRLPKMMRLTPSKKTPLFNGALDCRLYEFKMVAGSNRGKAGVKSA